jgi:hypothetical protein
MTAKQKANELVDRYVEYVEAYSSQGQIENAKICALIAVNEIVKRTRSVDTMPPNCQKIDDNTKEYWLDVKREIQAI